MILIGLVDGRGRFIWASCGQPGNCRDSALLQSTSLWESMYDICHLKSTMLGDVLVPSLILGDGAFPFRTYMMKRFSQSNLNIEQKTFNKKLSSAKMSVENAFGMLKARFRVLSRKCESYPENVKYKCLACVVLHNILLERGEIATLDNERVDFAMVRHDVTGPDNAAASRVRDALMPLVI